MAKEYTSSMNTQEVPIDLDRCKAAVPNLTGIFCDQCRRKAKASGWCWQHDPNGQFILSGQRQEELRRYKAQLAESAARTEVAVVLRRQLAEAMARRRALRAALNAAWELNEHLCDCHPCRTRMPDCPVGKPLREKASMLRQATIGQGGGEADAAPDD